MQTTVEVNPDRSVTKRSETDREPEVPEAPAPETPLTNEQLQERRKNAFAGMGWTAPPAEDLPKPPTPTPAPAAAPAPAPAPEEAELTADELISQTADQTAKSVVREMAPLLQPTTAAPAPSAAPAAPSLELSPEDQADFQIIQFLEGSNPGKYRGKSQAFLDYTKQHYAYQDEWLAKNEGKEFSADDEDHADWYAKHPAPVTAEELEEGKVDMLVDSKVKARMKPIEEKDEKQRKQESLHKALPTIAQNIQKRIVMMVEAADPELGKLLRDDKGNPSVASDRVALVTAADPTAEEILTEIANNELEPLVFELEQTTVQDLNYAIDAERNPVHRIIDQFRIRAEELLAKAPDQQKRDGKQWVPIADMRKMLDGKSEAEQAKVRAAHWSITVDDLEDQIVSYFGNKAKQKIEKRRALEEKKYGKRQPVTPNSEITPTPAPPPPIPQPSPSHSTKPTPPGMSSAGDVTIPQTTAPSGQKSKGEVASDQMFPK